MENEQEYNRLINHLGLLDRMLKIESPDDYQDIKEDIEKVRKAEIVKEVLYYMQYLLSRHNMDANNMVEICMNVNFYAATHFMPHDKLDEYFASLYETYTLGLKNHDSLE